MSKVVPTGKTYSALVRVWLYPGKAAWHFVTIPEKTSAEISDRFDRFKRGWGSLPVTATVGSTSWKTSIFPDKKSGGYLLPVKASVRKKENISLGDTLSLVVKVEV